MKRLFRSFATSVAIMLAALCLFAACGGETGKQEGPKPVTSIEITGKPDGNKLEVGKSVTLGYSAQPEDADDFTVTWKSSDSAKATVDDSGKVTGVAAGSVVISVSVDGTDISATAPLLVEEPFVPNPITDLLLSGVDAENALKRGETKTFKASAEPADCDPYEIEWNCEPAGVVEVAEYADSVALIGENYGTATVTAAVTGTEIVKTFEVTVAGDVDENNGAVTETFSRGAVQPNGVMYTNADRTATLENGAPVYEGVFLEAAAVNRPNAAEVSLEDGKLVWTLYNSANYERITFLYTGEIDKNKTYLIRIPMESTAFSNESGLGINVNYGIRVLKGENADNDPEYGLTFNNTATSGLNEESVDSMTAYNVGAPVADVTARDRANVVFTRAGESDCIDIYASGATWNGEFYIGCDGGRNMEEAAAAEKTQYGSVTLAFDNVLIIDTAEVEYSVSTETFDGEEYSGDTNIVNTFKENATMSSDLLTITANRSNFFAIRDEITAGTASSYGDTAPAGSTGKIFRWCSSRIVDENTDFSTPSPEGAAGLVHQTLTFKFNEDMIDPAKGYTVTIPVMLAQTDVSAQGQKLVSVADLNIKAYDSTEKDTLLNEGNTYLFDARNRKGVLELVIAPDSGWDGTVLLCFYWDGVTGRQIDGTEILSQATFYFDNIQLSETIA